MCALGAFRDDEGGFTTVAVAIALLLSMTLVFASASAGWVASRSSEVQRVADAAALAGSNAVAGFTTVAQVLDACVLSMGLAGTVVFGAGLVASCVPGLTSVGVELCATGERILEARRGFARTAAAGLERLEATLPLIVVANSASCVAANSGEGLSYTGCAIPLPTTSASDFSALLADVDDSAMSELSEEMRAASEEAQEARERALDALERGWFADCGSTPYSLYERAGTLAGLAGSQNPYHASADTWGFGVALLRARRYYAARLAAERVEGSSAERLTDAACRRAYYEYALGEVRSGFWVENEDGTVEAGLPRLPRNADETRACELYTQAIWPCTNEGGARVLHAASSCPGARGAASGSASLAQVHRARLITGEDVAVKVQRPGAQQVMAQDIDIMRSLVRHISRFVKTDQFIDLHDVVEELWQSFREETNFLMEARNLDEFYAYHASPTSTSAPSTSW